jgi:serine/threonine-protein kinase HipA
MIIPVELFENDHWKLVGTWEPQPGEENRGFSGGGTWRYAMDYALENLHRPQAAVSLDMPIVLDSVQRPRWPAFMLDLLPGGPARDQWLSLLRIPNGPAADIPLLQHAGRAPVGNLRIAHASRIGLAKGFSRYEVLERQQRFLAYMRDSLAAQLGLPRDTPYSSVDSQGAAPKYLLTEDHDGLWWAEGTLADKQCARFWLVKFPRGPRRQDALVLKAEATYTSAARLCGALVGEEPLWENDMLFIPRFDREATPSGKVRRHGLETLCSALGVSEFGHSFRHEELCAGIAKYSSDPAADLLEYLRRDILNIALANSDNHARNTSFIKRDGQVRLTPLYDFAPMELDPEGVSRQIRWQGEALYTLPARHIVEFLSTWISVDRIMELLNEMAQHLEHMENILRKSNTPADVIEYCQERWAPLGRSLREAQP